MSNFRFSDGSVDTLRLSVAEQEKVSRELDHRAKATKLDSRRVVRRYRYVNDQGVPMRVRHPGGTEVFIRVGPRDLSEHGMGFLSGGYLHAGTGIEFVLCLKSGEKIPITATVVRCEHVSGRIHDVGIKFATPVEMSEVADVILDESAVPGAKSAGQKMPQRT